MKRLNYVVLASLLLLLGVYGLSATYAQDENSENEQSSEAMSGEGTVSENPADNPSDEPNNDSEAAPGDEQPPLESDVYSCPECGYTSDGPGDCPACNRSLVKGQPHTDTDSTGGDSSEPTGDDSSSDSSDSSSE